MNRNDELEKKIGSSGLKKKRFSGNSNKWRFLQAINRVISLVANLKHDKIIATFGS